MAKTEEKKESRIKVKKKAWYKIIASQAFGNREIGETYMASPESGLGRVMKANLKELTGNIKDQNAYISFKMERAEGNVLGTSVLGYELIPSYVRRLVRKNADRLDDAFMTKTKSSKKVVVKTLLVTISKTKRSVQSKIRRTLMALIREEMEKGEIDAFIINTLVDGKNKSSWKKVLDKIYPLKELTIRWVHVLDSTKEAAQETMPLAESPSETSQEGQVEPVQKQQPLEEPEQAIVS